MPTAPTYTPLNAPVLPTYVPLPAVGRYIMDDQNVKFDDPAVYFNGGNVQ